MQRIQYHQYGGPEVMRLEHFELEAPGKGEVALRVRYAAINPIDWKLRQGEMKIVTGKRFPRAMGMDLSGTVTAVGPGVTRFKVGDAVFGQARFKQCGALGEAAIASENALAHKPASLSFEQAACLGSPGVTAWNALFDKGRLVAGQHILINGCMGAVGEAAVQLARKHGIRVSGTCGAADMDRARSLGVETVFDYRLVNLAHTTQRYDAVLDTSATLPGDTGLALLKDDGVLLDLHPTPGKFIKALFSRRLKMVVCTPTAEILEQLGHAAGMGALRLPIAKEVALDEAIALLTAIEGGQRLRGKAVVRMG
ncbi:MAG: NAD(P)-dependent alcohol dehydrogenase [Duganella sp.]